MPTEQLLQRLAPDAEYIPTEQIVQVDSSTAPVTVEYLPATQEEQLEEAVPVAKKEPAGQLVVHTDAPAEENNWDAHDAQLVLADAPAVGR